VAAGRDILLDIDIQGARQIRAHYVHDAVTIFVLPPSFDELGGGYVGAAPRTMRQLPGASSVHRKKLRPILSIIT